MGARMDNSRTFLTECNKKISHIYKSKTKAEIKVLSFGMRRNQN